MRSFDEIYMIAVVQQGGASNLEARLTKDERAGVSSLSDWLDAMARAVFLAGSSEQLIDERWDAFQTAFDGFDVHKVAEYGGDEMDRLVADKSIICNGAKLTSVIGNARFLRALEAETGGASSYLARWPIAHHNGLLHLLAKRGIRLGGVTGQRVCRLVGRDSYVLGDDVCNRLIAEDIITKANPTTKSALKSVQVAFNTWHEQSGRPLSQISQILACSSAHAAELAAAPLSMRLAA